MLKQLIPNIISVIALLSLCVPSAAQKVELRVDMPRGRQQIGIGDEFHITYKISDIQAQPEQPRNVGGAKLLYFDRTGQSSRFESINGRTSQSVTYTWTATFRALKEGTYSFGPVSVGGVKSNTVHYSIGKAVPQQSAQQQGNGGAPGRQDQDSNAPKFIGKGDGHLFLKANVSKSNAYEQEALVYTVKLYTTYSAIKFIGATSAPKFQGFVVEESKNRDTQFNYETYNGKTYATAVIARYIIFPQMQGALKVIGNTYTVSVDQREYYSDPFWGALSYSTPLQLNVTPNDLVVNVKPLPAPRPADFSGGVGQFRLSVSLPSASLKSNLPASVVYTVSGQGNLKYIKMPDLNALYPRQLEVYSPETEVKADVGASNVSGSVRFDYSFLPLETGNFHIPEVTLVYFNPATGKYEKTAARGFDVVVAQGVASDKSQTRNRLTFDGNLMPYTGLLSKSTVPDVYKFTYWLWYILPVILFILSVIFYRRYIKLHADMDAFNARRAGKIAVRRLKKAYYFMEHKDPDNFYTEMLSALWGYVANKLKMSTSELTRDNVRSEFESHNIPAPYLDSILSIIDSCECAKYSPGSESLNMRNIYDKASAVIVDIENSIKKYTVKTRETDKLNSPYDLYMDSRANDTSKVNDNEN